MHWTRLPSILIAQTDAAETAPLADTDPAADRVLGLDLSNVDVPMLVHDYGLPALKVLLLVIIGWIIAGWISRMTTKAMTKARVEVTLAKFLGRMARWAILVLVGLACLDSFGIRVTAFAAVIAAAGFAIGMAFSGTLGNFAAGVMLLVFRPFRVGDVVNVAGHAGKVDEIDLFVTTLDTPDNRRLIIPNGSIFGASIENVSHHPRRRVDIAVGTDYGADIDRTREVLLEAAGSIEAVLLDPAPAVLLLELGSSSINWSVRVWVNAADFWPTRDALTRAIKYALDRAEICIPFPQMDVHFDSPLPA
jgi:small conductance mechanosensitive channel